MSYTDNTDMMVLVDLVKGGDTLDGLFADWGHRMPVDDYADYLVERWKIGESCYLTSDGVVWVYDDVRHVWVSCAHTWDRILLQLSRSKWKKEDRLYPVGLSEQAEKNITRKVAVRMVIPPQKNVIVWRDGTYDLDSMTFRDHDRSDMAVADDYVLFDFAGPDAAPRYHDFLLRLVGGDDEMAKWWDAAMGIIVSGRAPTQLQKILYLWGAAGSGKGTMTHVVAGVMPDGWVIRPSAKNMESRFFAANMAGKRLAVLDDISAKDLKKITTELKTWSANSMTSKTVEAKHEQDQATVDIIAGWIITTNDAPSWGTDPGMTRRYVGIRLDQTQTISYDQMDPDFAAKLLKAERPEIMRRWLRAAAATEGTPKLPQKQIDEARKMGEAGSYMLRFLLDFCEDGGNKGIIKLSDLRKASEEWRIRTRHNTLGKSARDWNMEFRDLIPQGTYPDHLEKPVHILRRSVKVSGTVVADAVSIDAMRAWLIADHDLEVSEPQSLQTKAKKVATETVNRWGQVVGSKPKDDYVF